jgi:hypothetical protein
LGEDDQVSATKDQMKKQANNGGGCECVESLHREEDVIVVSGV